MLFVQPHLNALLSTNKVEDLRKAVQVAIELEHSTMPPYLYALYSLGTSNQDVADTLLSVVQEEMLHMLLMCNLLNAIGGQPSIDRATFVPDYPTALPGTVESGLKVPLEPFSKVLAETVFMKIEEPEFPINFPVAADALPMTIGQFYAGIKNQLQNLGPSVFTGSAGLQATTDQFPFSADQEIKDLASALEAVDLIVHQGEGTKESPQFDTNEFAHYYRFAEFVKGRKLIPNPAATAMSPPQERYLYGGAVVTIDAAGILPLRKNPKASQYPIDSDARKATDDCNRIYTKMLKSLHSTFNGSPAELDQAIGMMRKLRTSAKHLTQIALPDGTRAGPSFEYLP